jgi:hypothetical protein
MLLRFLIELCSSIDERAPLPACSSGCLGVLADSLEGLFQNFFLYIYLLVYPCYINTLSQSFTQ